MPGPERVVILGGGLGGLSAAFELSDPRHPKRYDVTLYQLGWRLGGKGASGRKGSHMEIEEHGIHVFFGSYDNGFDLMQRCYRELGRPPSAPIDDWTAAFKPHEYVYLMEHVNAAWSPWQLHLPVRPGTPGDPRPPEPLWDLFKEMLEGVEDHAGRLIRHASTIDPDPPVEPPHWWRDVRNAFGRSLAPEAHFGEVSLHLVREIAHSLDAEAGKHTAREHSWLGWLLDHLRLWLATHVREFLESHTEIRRLWILFDFALTHLRGILADGLLFPGGFDRINRYDYRDWLTKNGGSAIMTESVLVRAIYDLVFAYPGGDRQRRGDLEAGSYARILLNLLRYRGGAIWKMQAGMGDIVFAPLYEVLKERGVKFKFFHRVVELSAEPADPEPRIASVRLSRQVRLKDPNKEYDPLVDVAVEGYDTPLPCWPLEPCYEQIVEGKQLQEEGIDLESFWTPWKDTGGDSVLEHGRDFEHLIFAIPVGSVPFLCSQLMEMNNDWRTMVDVLPTVETQSFQLHMKPTLQEMGWKAHSPILGTYSVSALSNWADMSQTIPVEVWPRGEVGNIPYLCGMLEAPDEIPPASEIGYPDERKALVRRIAREFLEKHAHVLWPRAVDASGRFDWDTLVGSFDDQIMRPNISPSERYVRSPKDTTPHKLAAGNSGFQYLYLAGDWTDNGVNVGCVEAAVVSGRQAARAIAGGSVAILRDHPIEGWKV